MMNLRTALSVSYIASCAIIAYLGFHFNQLTSGLAYYGPSGEISLCNMQEGSGADSDVTFFALVLFSVPALIRVMRLNRDFRFAEVSALVVALLSVWLVGLDGSCGDLTLTAEQNSGYFISLITALVGVLGLAVVMVLMSLKSGKE